MNVKDRDRRILLLKSEVEEISAFTGLSPETFCKKTTEELFEPYEYEIVKVNGKCFFLSEGRCTIYEKRPLVCRFYPFWLEKEGDTWVFGVDEDCPGIGVEKPLGEEFFKKLLEMALSKLSKM